MIIFLIFPTQLFEYKYFPKNIKYDSIYIIEEPIYFTKYKFHKLKLAYHRASMKSYYDYLGKYVKRIKYYEFSENYMSDLKNHTVFFYNPIDHNLIKKIQHDCNPIPLITLVIMSNMIH
jgi:deoxyribodipyrimidine photolyase-related protein